MVFHWNLSDSKSPQVSWITNAVVWMVSARPPISTFSSPFTYPLVTIQSAPFIIGITETFMFHNYFSPLVRSKYLYLFSFSLIFSLQSAVLAKFIILHVFFFFFFFFFVN